MEINAAISLLERMPTRILNAAYESAIRFAVGFMKEHCDKPSLDAYVFQIRYYRPYRKNWEYYRHVPTGETLGHMKIGTLVELAKSGALDKDKFASITSGYERRLDSSYVVAIKRMLLENGYVTREDLKEG